MKNETLNQACGRVFKQLKRKDIKKKKIWHKVVRIEGKTKNGNPTLMEFGWVENPTFDNDIYTIINSAHKGGSGSWELRTDEALLYIQGLTATIRQKLTGVSLILKEDKDEKEIEQNWKKIKEVSSGTTGWMLDEYGNWFNAMNPKNNEVKSDIDLAGQKKRINSISKIR